MRSECGAMLKQSIINNFAVYIIISPDGQTRASFVPELGGVGCSIIMPHQGKSRELLYLHDNFWEKDLQDLRGGWPFLFPICGRLELKEYQLPIHGFAPYIPLAIEDANLGIYLQKKLAFNLKFY